MYRYAAIIFGIALQFCLLGQETELVTEKYNRKNIKAEYHVSGKRRVKNGDFKSYFYGGGIKEMGSYANGEKNGKWTIFDTGGSILEIRHFDLSKRIGIWEKHMEAGQVIKRYDWGRKIAIDPLINLVINYPALARENKTQGTVVLSYKLDQHCKLREVKIVQSLKDGCDRAAVKGLTQYIRLAKKYDASLCSTTESQVRIEFNLN